MESNIKKLVNENKGFVVFYLIWFLLHLSLLAARLPGGGYSGLWPFGFGYSDPYNFKDLLIYLIFPIVIWGLWKIVGQNNNTKIDENK